MLVSTDVDIHDEGFKYHPTDVGPMEAREGVRNASTEQARADLDSTEGA
jgi:hypothetical protein